MEARKFAENGGTLDDALPPDSGLAQALNQPGDDPEGLYKHIRQMTAAKPAKPKVITKEALAKSGLSLRDYMNKQQGLTRRKDRTVPRNEGAPSAFRKGGSVSSRADGIAQRGKTRGKMC